MLISLLCSGLVFATESFVPTRILPVEWQLSKAQLHFELEHGPDKPLPDGGYDFKSKKNDGSTLAKIGFVMVCASGVTAVRMLRAPTDSDLRRRRATTSATLGATGIGLILWVRLR